VSLVNLVNLGVNGSTTLNGTTTLNGVLSCPGGALAPNCFGISVCPDFTLCNLRAQSLSVFSTNVSVIPQLLVGMQPGDVGNSVVNLGLPGANAISTLTSNVNGLYYMSSNNTAMLHRAWFNTATFESVGGTSLSTNIGSSGSVNITAGTGVSILSGSTTGSIFAAVSSNTFTMNGNSQSIAASTLTYNVSANNINFVQGNLNPWFNTQPTTTLECQIGGALPPVAGTSIAFGTDLIMATGTRLMSAGATGLISMSGILLCGQLIKSSSTTVEVQDSTNTKFLDVWATIQNTDSLKPVTFNDGDGVSFFNTPIINGAGTPVLVAEANGLRVSAGPLIIKDNLQAPLNVININTNASGYAGGAINMGTSGTETTILGDLWVVGNINGAGTCSGCVSDARVKEEVREVAPRLDLHTILSLPRRVSYRFTKAYQSVDRFVKDHIHHGFIAQELESVLPRAVQTVNQTLGNGQLVSDFRRVLYDRIVPHVAGAVKELHAMHMALREDYEALREEVRELRSKLKAHFP